MAGSPVSPGGSVNLQNGQVAIANTATPLFEDVMLDEPEPFADPTTAASTNVNAEAERLISEFDRGLVVKEVTGTVMMAPAGTNVIDLLRNSTSLPKLKAGDVIPSGASIRTDFGATMIVAQSPGVTMQVLENTNMLIEENNYALQNGVEKRSFRANLKKGGVINNLEGVDPNNTKYEIQTPLAVAAARGTAYSVFTSNNITVVITANGDVEVITRGGTYRTLSGQKTVVTFDPGTGQERTAEFGATAEELQIIQNLIAAAEELNDYLSTQGTGGRRVSDDRGLTKTDESGGGGTQDDQTFFDRADPNDPNQYQNDLDAAVDDFLNTFQPRLNPGAITPIQSGQ